MVTFFMKPLIIIVWNIVAHLIGLNYFFGGVAYIDRKWWVTTFYKASQESICMWYLNETSTTSMRFKYSHTQTNKLCQFYDLMQSFWNLVLRSTGASERRFRCSASQLRIVKVSAKWKLLLQDYFIKSILKNAQKLNENCETVTNS